MILEGMPGSGDDSAPAIVVGAGPAGLVHALELRRRGIEVIVLAGGVDGLDPRYQELSDADIADPRRHAPMRLAVGRAFGGSSLLWGGRCVAFDDVDFDARPHVPHSGWPLRHSEIRAWYEVALRYLDGGAGGFCDAGAPLGNTPECRFDRLERWSEGRDLRRLHHAALAHDDGLQVHLGVVAVGLEVDPVEGRVSGVVAALPSGERRIVRGRAIVLACGGLETTRLLLAARQDCPGLFGGAGAALGRFYMGHPEGCIADIVFNPCVPAGVFGFFVDASGRYARRRITVAEEAQDRYGLLNMAAFPINPPLADPAHRSAILSLAYLCLAAPVLGPALAPEAIRRKHVRPGNKRLSQHFGNVLRGFPGAAADAVRFLDARYRARPRVPGFEIDNRAGRYALFYHAEQAPNRDSTVSLSDRSDRLGMPGLRIDLRFSDLDAHSVVASHDVIDRNLQQAGIGRLDYKIARSERHASVLDEASDGYHQIGTTRMSAVPAAGVVDRDCRVHGTPNLFIASSSVFPTSGQANPTLLLTALSARLAAHVAGRLTAMPEIAASQRAAVPA